MDGKLTLEQLESFLDETCDSLREDRDAVSFKEYVLAILFLKRLNDRFNLEREMRRKKLSSQGLSLRQIEEDLERKEVYRLFVPKIARWDIIKEHKEDLPSYLTKAFAEIEEKNRGCLGLLTTIDFKKLTENGIPLLTDRDLLELIRKFEHLTLSDDYLDF
ncbi:type I restriction-modification system subunit M N-terminal domain-containing protein [Desulfosporosinus sp. SB140]|uniref:type I restriction-modification system subunit M N-terminal domain-containing protein n=1 Tax=Desulfosporosinus paludis TaxID=3115649 RepID=UPI003890DAEF